MSGGKVITPNPMKIKQGAGKKHSKQDRSGTNTEAPGKQIGTVALGRLSCGFARLSNSSDPFVENHLIGLREADKLLAV